MSAPERVWVWQSTTGAFVVYPHDPINSDFVPESRALAAEAEQGRFKVGMNVWKDAWNEKALQAAALREQVRVLTPLARWGLNFGDDCLKRGIQPPDGFCEGFADTDTTDTAAARRIVGDRNGSN